MAEPCTVHRHGRPAAAGALPLAESGPRRGKALEPVRQPTKAVATKWTCPMHPEIVRDEPGSCPICGMTLEPMTVSAEEQKSAELLSMTRRFRVSTAVTIPVFLIAMSESLP